MTNRLAMDVLMITHNRPDYTRLSLSALLESCDDRMRVRVWHNGPDADTRSVIASFVDHPKLAHVHLSDDNVGIPAAINWMIESSPADLLAVINDDCVVCDDWGAALREAHEDVDEFGVIACWHFPFQDYEPEIARRKIRTFERGRQLLVNAWVQGSGVAFKRRCADVAGPVSNRSGGFTGFCRRIALAGWTNGWPLPLVPIDHMDDPRSPRTALHTDEDLLRCLPLTAQGRKIRTLNEWTEQIRSSARAVQRAPMDPRCYFGLRKKVRRVMTRLRGEELVY